MRSGTLRPGLLGLAVAALAATALVAPPAAAATRADTGRSAITALWAWGNPIDPAQDARGLGQPEFEPEALASFAAAHRLRTVFLSVPWAADQGAFATWLPAAVRALHGAGVTTVAALGGDPEWAERPELAVTWMRAALRTAPFDAVQFDVEPWVGAAEEELPGVVARLGALYDAAARAAGTTPVGADLPWWLALKPAPHGGTLFGTLLPHLRSVAIVAFIDHAEGPDGILALTLPAVGAATAARVPFTVGVETDTPEVAGGPGATFGDQTAAALEAEAAIVRARLERLSGYRGVVVEHLLSWRKLLEH